MQINAIKTHRIEYGDRITDILDRYIPFVSDGSILAITSKILSVIEGRLIEKNSIDKFSLIYREADLVLKSDKSKVDIYLTIKNGFLIPSAGIDESNVDNSFVLYPINIQKTAAKIWEYLREKYELEKFGVVITDSMPIIMRRGVIGVGIGWCGFLPLYSYTGKPDIYNNPLKITQVNILDSLATGAVFSMGEGNEQTPIAVITGAPHIVFVDRTPSNDEENSIIIPLDEDLYGPLLKTAKWDKKVIA